jgi:hypothetical protein
MDRDPDFPDREPVAWDPKKSHYLTCPDAKEFAKKRKGADG